MEELETNSFYFLSTGENDLTGHNKLITTLDSTYFSKLKNPSFHYYFKKNLTIIEKPHVFS